MTKPAPFPVTDEAEQNAVNVLRSLLDPSRVKENIQTRDKYPNVDGTIELVDDNRLPVGKFDTQIKKIPYGTRKFNCPTRLVAYSQESTLPVVLICVDVEGRKAYWKTISMTMPEFRDEQKSFTVCFDPISDGIDARKIYLKRWRELIEDYKSRIAQYPVLKKQVANKLSVDALSQEEKTLFQHFVDRINHLLDGDFVAVKKIMLGDVWKLGVGVYEIDHRVTSYQIYKIPYGMTWPLICTVDENTFELEGSDSVTLSRHWVARSHINDPEGAGESLVYDYVKDVVGNRKLAIQGPLIAKDVLFSFLDGYSHCLGLSDEKDTYSLTELRSGLSEHLPGICERFAREYSGFVEGQIVELELEMLSQVVLNHDIKPIPIEKCRFNFSLHSRSDVFYAVEQSIDYLSSVGMNLVERPFRRLRKSERARNRWIWSGISKQDEIYNVNQTLLSAVREYPDFVKGNRLIFPRSVYIDDQTSIVFVYERKRRRNDSEGWPILHEYIVDNSLGHLPKVITFFDKVIKPKYMTKSMPTIKINRRDYGCRSFTTMVANFLFQETPILHLIYRFLRADLREHYGISAN